MELYEKLKQNAINDHITILNSLKEFFCYVKLRDTKDERFIYFDLSSHLITLSKLKKKTSRLYQKLIKLFPDDQAKIKLYFFIMKILFIKYIF